MMFLNQDQMIELTGFQKRPAQVRALREMGITHKVRADGYPIVLTAYIEKELGGLTESKQRVREPDYGAL